MAGIFHSPFDVFQKSPLGKEEPNSFRLTHHMSFPEKRHQVL